MPLAGVSETCCHRHRPIHKAILGDCFKVLSAKSSFHAPITKSGILVYIKRVWLLSSS